MYISLNSRRENIMTGTSHISSSIQQQSALCQHNKVLHPITDPQVNNFYMVPYHHLT